MIYLDTTKTAQAGHHSGLTRVTARLGAALGDRAIACSWNQLSKAASKDDDWFLTAELFCEAERPGFWDLLAQRPCRFAAVFHDAIPLKHPHITWPQSVARHPEYMKMLAHFDRVWAVSSASRTELMEFWSWQRIGKFPEVGVLPLGADFDGGARGRQDSPSTPPVVLCLGILEPRKNQEFLLQVCRGLWDSGLRFELHFVGRLNPHFGKPIAARLRNAQKACPGLHVHEAVPDGQLAALMARTRVLAFPTMAEGCGLPVLEALWKGIPCLASDLPPIRENAVGGGCLCVKAGDEGSWSFALSRLLVDDGLWGRLARDAATRPLGTWADTASRLVGGLS